jgi:hypothetical protein
LLTLLLAAIVPMAATHATAPAMLSTMCAPLAPSANWQIETVADSSVRPDIAVDLDRHAHLVYRDAGCPTSR